DLAPHGVPQQAVGPPRPDLADGGEVEVRHLFDALQRRLALGEPAGFQGEDRPVFARRAQGAGEIAEGESVPVRARDTEQRRLLRVLRAPWRQLDQWGPGE